MTRIRSVPSRRWQLASTACAMAAAAGLAFIPTGSSQSGQSASVDSAGNIVTNPVTSTITHTTLLQVQGPSILVTLAIPVVLN